MFLYKNLFFLKMTTIDIGVLKTYMAFYFQSKQSNIFLLKTFFLGGEILLPHEMPQSGDHS